MNVTLSFYGDGVYHLLTEIEEKSEFRIYACKEDLEARAIKTNEKVLVPESFYTVLVEDLMENCERAYTF
jgi:tRNA 2-thiouridine synthesizing protein B